MSLGEAVALATRKVVQPVEGMHRHIARRWFRRLDPIARPVERAHDGIALLVYGSIRLGASAIEKRLEWSDRRSSPGGEAFQAFVTGLWGDRLGPSSSLRTPTTLRSREGEELALGPDLSALYPAATGHLVVLVHGLLKTERSWHNRADRPGFFQHLDADPLLTPVSVRYNTGLPVAHSGVQLAGLIEQVRKAWPVEVESISLVGHSMGGLVVLSACEAAREAGHDWLSEVTDLVTIGTPHRGAPLEKLANAAAWGLNVAPTTRPLADFLNSRSRGIRDLRFGLSGEPAGSRRTPHPEIRHHFVAGVITANPGHPIGAMVGDLMVRPSSGTGHESWEPTNSVVLGGVHHFDLLHEPEVIEHVMEWLGSAT